MNNDRFYRGFSYTLKKFIRKYDKAPALFHKKPPHRAGEEFLSSIILSAHTPSDVGQNSHLAPATSPPDRAGSRLS